MKTTIESADVEVVVVVVNFKSWRDCYLFLKNYGNFTCLNCKGSSHNLDTDIEHTDSEYARFFCSKTVAMVRLDFQFVCSQWEHKDTNESLKDLADKGCEETWNISDRALEILDQGDRKWSFEEIKELVENESD